MARTIAAATFVIAIAVMAIGAPVRGAAAAAGGTIKGRVKLAGPAPANPMIRMGADPLCARLVRQSGKRPTQELVVVDAMGGLANVFVDLQGTFPAVTAPPKDPVVITQRGCVYTPRVVGVRVGQTLRIVNADTLLHNLHGISTKDNGFNTTQPGSGMVNNFPMKTAETLLHLTCDVHSWMSAYVGVESHPYFAVSGADGTFTLANVPPGRRTIRAWHERYGWITRTVDVKPGGTATVELGYTGTEKPATRTRHLVVPAGSVALFTLSRAEAVAPWLGLARPQPAAQ
jgi:plastocyanin